MSYGDFVIFDVKKIKKFTNGEFSRTSGTASLGVFFQKLIYERQEAASQNVVSRVRLLYSFVTLEK